jgi:hypothetical protein
MCRTPTQIQAEEEGRGLVEVWPEQIQAKEEEGRPRNCQLCCRGGRGLEAAPVGGGRRTRRTPALLARTEEDGATPSALDAASAMASARSECGGGGGGWPTSVAHLRPALALTAAAARLHREGGRGEKELGLGW